MAQIGVFSPEDAKDVAEATRRVLGKAGNSADMSRRPSQPQPVYRVKITGAADADGVYPALFMQLDPSTLAWTELGECYAYKVDTI